MIVTRHKWSETMTHGGKAQPANAITMTKQIATLLHSIRIKRIMEPRDRQHACADDPVAANMKDAFQQQTPTIA